MSLLIWINATILEMLLSYFVFHQHKLDASFCRRMFHPPLLASNFFLFASVKTEISIQLISIASFCLATRNTFFKSRFVQFNRNVTPATLLNFGWTTQKEIGFPYMCWEISFKSSSRVVPNLGRLSSTRCSVLWDCATFIGTVLDKCWIEAIELLSFTIKWAKIVPTHTWCLFLCYNKPLHHPLYK